MSHIGAVRACYETEAQRNPGLKGGVTVAWQIDSGGNVIGASVAGTTLSNPRVEVASCVRCRNGSSRRASLPPA